MFGRMRRWEFVLIVRAQQQFVVFHLSVKLKNSSVIWSECHRDVSIAAEVLNGSFTSEQIYRAKMSFGQFQIVERMPWDIYLHAIAFAREVNHHQK